jgi:hypothetical protein
MEEIILWETDGERIRACKLAIYKALKNLGRGQPQIFREEEK